MKKLIIFLLFSVLSSSSFSQEETNYYDSNEEVAEIITIGSYEVQETDVTICEYSEESGYYCYDI